MIPINDLVITPQVEAEVREAIDRVLRRGWYLYGPELESFEREFARYCHVEHGVGVANGTDALELGLRSLGVGHGDDVIVAANAGMYATTALRAIGARPVFADVDPGSLNLSVETVAPLVEDGCKAILVTHLFGRMADMATFRDLADSVGVKLMEDCAQAHGARQHGRPAGCWGDAAAFSFYPTKNLGAMGDGGMVTTPSEEVGVRLRRLRQYGWKTKYVSVEDHGRNSRLDEMQAAVLRAKLPYLDKNNTRRQAIARAFAAVEHNDITHPDVEGPDYVAHLYVLRSENRDSLREHLATHEIQTAVHYPMLDTQQPSLPKAWRNSGRLMESEKATSRILTLPCYPGLGDEKVAKICQTLRRWQST